MRRTACQVHYIAGGVLGDCLIHTLDRGRRSPLYAQITSVVAVVVAVVVAGICASLEGLTMNPRQRFEQHHQLQNR